MKKYLYIATGSMVAFILWTIGVSFIDVGAIGPENSSVGFSAVNEFFHKLTGVHMSLYVITDWLGLVPLLLMTGFAITGLMQLFKRRSFFKVDYSLLVLGGFYVIVFTAYILFEVFVINYRPVLIDGILEASYPSSTTMLVMCVMPTAISQFNARIKSRKIRLCLSFTIASFTIFMVLGRLISGVHWLSDIVGGALLSTGLLMMYYFTVSLK